MLTNEDRELRRTGIGASEIGVLAGLSRWSSPIAIYEAKVGAPPDDTGLAAELGSALEEPIARIYARERGGLHLAECATLRHEVQTFALATPDRLIYPAPRARVTTVEEAREAQGNVEIKSTSWRLKHEWGEPGTDEVPEQYLAQATWQMGVTGQRSTEIVVLFDKDRIESYTVPFNDELWRGLLEIGARFWRDNVMARRPPEPDATDRYREYLDRAWPRPTGALVHVPTGSDVDVMVRQLAMLKVATKRAKAAAKRIENSLLAVIGQNLGLVGDFGTLKWHRAPPKGSKVDFEAVAVELEAMVGILLNASPPWALNAEMAEQLRTVRERHSKPGRAFNQVRGTWSESLGFEAKALDLRLEALEAGEEEAKGEAEQ